MRPLRTAIVHPVQANVLRAAMDAVQAGLIVPVLIGPAAKINAAAKEAGIDLSPWEIVHVEHSHAAAVKAVELAVAGQVAAIMKGSLHTDELLRAVVSSTSGLRTEHRVSHAYVMDVPSYHKLLIITDAAVNIAPDATTKADICQNAIGLWRTLFGEGQKPKVAILAAVETVNQKMLATVDAAQLCKMVDRGQIRDGILSTGRLDWITRLASKRRMTKA
jgi:phosphate acetyltransferase